MNRQAISWVKRNLKPTILIKVGPNYLIDEKEIEKLFESYMFRQKAIYKKKVESVKKLREKKAAKKSKN